MTSLQEMRKSSSTKLEEYESENSLAPPFMVKNTNFSTNDDSFQEVVTQKQRKSRREDKVQTKE